MNNQTAGKVQTKPKAASMSSLLAKKGDAMPAPDMQTRAAANAEEAIVAKQVNAENPLNTHESGVIPAVESRSSEVHSEFPVKAAESVQVQTPAPSSVSIPSAAVGSALGDMLRQIAASENVQKPTKVAMVPVNMKLPSDTIDKLKKIVGIEQYRRGNNFSQQNYLESRMVALIDLEYAALPKI